MTEWRAPKFRQPREHADVHGNRIAEEGCDRCFCGCKYWELDRCIDCGTHIDKVLPYQDEINEGKSI